ncbi:MAG: hypothetical protein ACPGDB_02385, partial [Fusobacterium sp.]
MFNQLVTLNSNYKYITSIAVLQSIYNELLSTETLDFKGEPLEGLQIMGMLESRVLDFETVIISSVNEGILPSGKTNNSFIPFDVKIENIHQKVLEAVTTDNALDMSDWHTCETTHCRAGWV